MVFSSPVFLFYFFPIVLLFYFISPAKNVVLFVFSLFFYAWGETGYVLILIAAILINYLFGLLIDKGNCEIRRRNYFGIGLGINLSILLFFKYANFFVANLNQVMMKAGLPDIHLEKVHLPLGISFFIFQAMSYLFDVYRKNNVAVRNPLDLGLYISMFPQLVAGPIVRFGDIANQLKNRAITQGYFTFGIRRFICGLSQKMLIANILAVPADAVFSIPQDAMTTSLAWLGTISYSLQIYFDFAGYSNMAIGLGAMFGFRLPENFNYPYISKSISEFWRRWHISLSSWFRDYLYIPLGGNRRGTIRTYVNLVTVFLLCGLWHGADWTFVLWGLYHGIFLVVERLGFKRWLSQQLNLFSYCYVILTICIGWVLFRSDSLDQAVVMISALFGFAAGTGTIYSVSQYLTREVLIILPLAIVFSMPVMSGGGFISSFLDKMKLTANSIIGGKMVGHAVETLILLVAFIIISYHLAAQTHNPFIYFRF